jgi:hypothetical protein
MTHPSHYVLAPVGYLRSDEFSRLSPETYLARGSGLSQRATDRGRNFSRGDGTPSGLTDGDAPVVRAASDPCTHE